MQGSIQPRRVLEGTGNVEVFPNLLLAGPKPLYKAERKDVILQPKVSNIAIIDPADCADTLLYKVRRGLMDGGKLSFSHQVHSDYVKTPSNPNEEKLNTQLCNSSSQRSRSYWASSTDLRPWPPNYMLPGNDKRASWWYSSSRRIWRRSTPESAATTSTSHPISEEASLHSRFRKLHR
jgi:hypothetical protein